MQKRLQQNNIFPWNSVIQSGRLLKIILLCIIIAGTSLYCSSEKIKKDDGRQNNTVLEYEHEGFIGENVYRIVIVVPHYILESKQSDIEKTARMRALSSLQKYLASQDKQVDHNITAELLSLIEKNGNLSTGHSMSKSRDIYYYDIKKERLKEYLLDLKRP